VLGGAVPAHRRQGKAHGRVQLQSEANLSIARLQTEMEGDLSTRLKTARRRVISFEEL
jgi:hypothetical protein